MATKRKYDLVQGEGTMESLRHYRWVAVLMVPLHMSLAFGLQQYVAPPEHPEMVEWASTVKWAHVVICGFVIFSGLLSHAYVRRGKHATAGAIVLQIAIAAGYFYFGAVISIADLVANAGAGPSSFMMICIMFGVLGLMRPGISVPLYTCACMLFAVMLLRAPIDPAHITSAGIIAYVGPMLALLASVIVWNQFVRAVMLRRELSRSNTALMAQQQELAFLADHDTLTGLYNRREFMRMANMELARAARAPCDTQLIMVDLDFFKKVNDQYGHPVGDAVLKQVAALLRSGIRTTDTVARLGGEEFIVLLPDTSREGALAVAEKLRMLVRAEPLVMEDLSVPVTASFGVSGLLRNQQGTVDSIYAAADRALYVAKQLGRDRVEYAEPESSELSSGTAEGLRA
ncbi:GGDEF domain-containing protein [Rhodoferax saidenbachensis]|uniref:diguanylate cyclase n=1 Tax=Rhodoferax saidenbachensis TaxID=1484693 RepID=A0ABU1ZQX0_9BURK|nr:GGDEF domain-containing protein [Rhodoferax saidenbachensis]MDR7306946.1 diguanylate cyclase (GGDEF)-like protein [Rhodoferax saidenbachensis]